MNNIEINNLLDYRILNFNKGIKKFKEPIYLELEYKGTLILKNYSNFYDIFLNNLDKIVLNSKVFRQDDNLEVFSDSILKIEKKIKNNILNFINLSKNINDDFFLSFIEKYKMNLSNLSYMIWDMELGTLLFFVWNIFSTKELPNFFKKDHWTQVNHIFSKFKKEPFLKNKISQDKNVEKINFFENLFTFKMVRNSSVHPTTIDWGVWKGVIEFITFQMKENYFPKRLRVKIFKEENKNLQIIINKIDYYEIFYKNFENFLNTLN